MKMHRFYDARISGLGFEPIDVRLRSFDVIKQTKCGVRIDDYSEKGRFINLSSKKQYACETEELALKSFISRKERQITILSGRLRDAEAALKIAKRMQK